MRPFFEDAKRASKLLGITLTTRDKKKKILFHLPDSPIML